MIERNENEQAVVDGLVQALGLEHPVKVSDELSELLKPNEFLTGLGIQYSERLKTILEILKANLVPKNSGPKETLPGREIVIPLTIAKGPFIREDPISIRAGFINDGGKAEILLSVILDNE
jgi:hypothetical protein